MNFSELRNSVFCETIIDSVPYPVIAIGMDHALLYLNAAAQKFSNIQFGGLNGYKCYQVFHEGDQPCRGDDHPCPLNQVRSSGQGVTVLHEHFHGKGKRRTVEINAVPLLKGDGTLLGIVETLRDVTAQRKRISEFDVVITLTSFLRNARTCSDILSVITKTVVDIVGAEAAAIALAPTTRDTIKIEHGFGVWKEREGSMLAAGSAILNDVIEKGEVYLSTMPGEQQRCMFPGKTEDLRSVACIPLIAQKQIIGAICIGRETLISEEEMWTLSAIADIAASAILRSTLHEQTELRLERLTALRAIDIAISSSLDLRVTLDVFLDQVTSKQRVDAAAVLLMNAHDHILEYAAGRGFRTTAIQSSKLRLGEGSAGIAALNCRTVRIADLYDDPESFDRLAMARGEHFVTYFAVPLLSKGHVKGILEVYHRSALDPDNEWLEFLEALAVQAAIAIDNAVLFNNLHRSNIDLVLAYDSTLMGWAQALDMRDKVTEGHAQRVTDLTVTVARSMNMSENELVHVRRGAVLHDIGKLGIPDNILLKPGPLNEEEWKIMRQHPIYAYQMLSAIDYLRPALHIPLCHHEKWDGTGYPHGLKSIQIPAAARIFTVIDVWDALLSDRPYRAAWKRDRVCDYIRERAGRDFDPEIVDIFLKNQEH